MDEFNLHLYDVAVTNVNVNGNGVGISIITDDIEGLLEQITYAVVSAAERKSGRKRNISLAIKFCNILLAEEPKYEIIRKQQ